MNGDLELNELLAENPASVLERERTLFDKLAQPFESSIVLFGAGFMGRKALKALRSAGMEPKCFADDNSALQETLVEGIQVLSPEDAAAAFGKSAAFVVTVLRPEVPYCDSAHRLTELGCTRVLSGISLFWKWPINTLPHSFIDLPSKLIRSADKIRNAYHLLSDDESRRHFLAQLKYRLHLDFDSFPKELPVAEQYFTNLVRSVPDERFADCGAFEGDTLQAFLQKRGDGFNRYVAIEPDPVNCARMRAFVHGLDSPMQDRISILDVAASDVDGKQRFNGNGTNGAAISATGNLEVPCRRLDTMLADEQITFLKMDIEGAEISALEGSKELIRRTKPVLAICVYHEQHHLWDIPLSIHSLNSGYSLFLRAYMKEGLELVCYAIPPDRIAGGRFR